MNKLEDKIKKSIRDKKPKPRRIFILTSIARDTIILLLWIATILLLGATIYLIQSTPWKVFSIPRYLLPAIIGLPWELIFIVIALIVVLYFITKNISTFYRDKKALVLILIISLFAGYFSAEATGLNMVLSKTKLIRPLYQRQGKLIAPRRGLAIIGEVLDIESKGEFTIKDLLEEKWKVSISEKTEIITDIKKGQFVSVIGDKNNDRIEALIIKPARKEPCDFGRQTNNGPRGYMRNMY